MTPDSFASDTYRQCSRFVKLFGVSWDQSQQNVSVNGTPAAAEEHTLPGESFTQGRYRSFDASESSTTTMFSAASSEGESPRVERYREIVSKDDNDSGLTTREPKGDSHEPYHSDVVTREHQAYKRRTWKNSGFLSQIGSITSFSIFSRGILISTLLVLFTDITSYLFAYRAEERE